MKFGALQHCRRLMVRADDQWTDPWRLLDGRTMLAGMSEKSKEDQDPERAGDPEMQDLARRYLDLWQDQMTALASDNEFVAAWRKMAEAMGAGQAFAQMGQPGAGADPTQLFRSMMAGAAAPQKETGDEPSQSGPETERESATDSKTGAPASAAASDGGGDDLELIARRLALLEERVAKLESKPKAPRKRASGGSRAKKS